LKLYMKACAIKAASSRSFSALLSSRAKGVAPRLWYK
jgi:hypothetical protein